MAITTSCPGCKSLFRLADELSGQEVRCQKCARLFTVPMLLTAVAPTTEPAPASQPPVPVPVAAPPTPAPELPAAVAPSPPVEVPAGKRASVPPEEEVFPATIAEPTAATPPPLPTPPKPASPAPVAPTALMSLVALLAFLLGTLAVGIVSAIWVFTHLAQPARVAFFSPPPPVITKEVAPPQGVLAVAVPLQLDRFGKVFFNSRIENPFAGFDHGRFGNDGPYRLCRIRLEEGKTYHFYVMSFAVFWPHMEIFDNDLSVAQFKDQATDRMMLTFRPARTGEFLIFITSQQRQPNNFNLEIALAAPEPARRADLKVAARFEDRAFLRLQDKLEKVDGIPDVGPYREYDIQLEPDKDYSFNANTPFFQPIVRIFEDGVPRDFLPRAGQNFVQFDYRTPPGVKVQARVTSKRFGLGNYTLRIERKSDIVAAAQTTRIIGQIDGTGRYEHRHMLNAKDPPEPAFPGRGPFKTYYVPLKQGEIYTIEMTSGVFDTYLGVYNSTDKQLATEVSPNGAGIAKIVFAAPATGTYRIHAAATRPKTEGEYLLRITTN